MRRSEAPSSSRSLLPWILGGVFLLVAAAGGVVFLLTRGSGPDPLAGGPGKVEAKTTPKKTDEPKGTGEPKIDTPGKKAKGAEGGIDLTYIAPDFIAAAVLHPRRLLASPLAKGVPGAMTAGLIQETGIDPQQVDQLIVLVETASAPPATPPEKPAPEKSAWKEYVSPEGKFAARFPLPPRMEAKKGMDGLMGGAVAELPDGTRFEVQFTDFDPAIAAVPNIMLDVVAKQFAAETKARKEVKFGSHSGLELLVEKGELAMPMRLYMVGPRMYHLLATSPGGKHDPAQVDRFFQSFRLTDGSAPKGTGTPEPSPPMPSGGAGDDLPFLPATILRFAGPVDAKQILEKNFGFLQSLDFAGKSYFQSQTRKQGGHPLAGFVEADGKTLVIAPEPTLKKMLAAVDPAGPLVDRLGSVDPRDDVSLVLLAAPLRPLAAALPPGLLGSGLDPKTLLGQAKAAHLHVRLAGDPIMRVEIEAEDAEAARALHKIAAMGIEMVRQLYPPLREQGLLPLPPDLGRPLVKIADQIYAGLALDLKDANVSLTLKRPVDLEAQPPPDLIASSGFNDAVGLDADPVPASPFPIGSNRSGGAGEPGWAGPWVPPHPAITYQNKVVFEGDGAVHVTGVDNVGPGFSRKLAVPQRGVFEVEMHVQVPAGGIATVYLNNGNQPLRDGPVWNVDNGRFQVVEAGVPPDTGFACVPGKWYKVTVQVDVPRKQWSFLVDGKRFKARQPLRFRNVDEPQFDTLAFLCRTGPGIYLDAVRITRLPDDALVKAFAPKPTAPLPPGHIASTGFNNAKGLHGDDEDGPFPLDQPDRTGGEGEPGWAGPWPAHTDAVFQSKVVFEGDGALFLKGRPNFGPNYGRRFSEPQTGRFELEYRIQVPAGSSCGAYLWRGAEGGAYRSGPNWSVGGGKFRVSDGDEGGGGKLLDAFPCKPGQWYKVTLRVDVEKRRWEFALDDQVFQAPRPLGFRTKVEYLDVINFLVEGGVYLDALRVTRLAAVDGK